MDSSAACIAAQGLIRIGNWFKSADSIRAKTYQQAGIQLASVLFSEPYLSTRESHQGLILHSIYHQPNGWDYVAEKGKVAHGESSMWGDYHARELAVLIQRMAKNEPYYTYLNCVPS